MNILALILAILIIGFANPAFAEGDLWDHFGDSNIYGQKPVTDEEFNEALERKRGKPKKSKDKLLRNGEAFQESNESEFLTTMPSELPILLVPVDLALDEERILPMGHYQVMGEKKDDKVYLKLYQAHTLLASFEAIETNDDFGEEEISFVRIIDDSEDKVKIIFGSLGFNAYTTMSIAR